LPLVPDSVKKRLSFSRLLPLAAFTVSAVLVLIPFIRGYSALRRMSLDSAADGSIEPRVVVPKGNLAAYALSISALREEPAITALNAPAQWVHLLVCLAMDTSAQWHPAGVSPGLWRVVSFPFYALPAWFFLGRGLDAFLKRTRLRRADAVASVGLALLFLSVSAVLRFDLNAAERQGQATWFMQGFGCWGILIAIPFAAWVWQRNTTVPA
jgi:hypothetical protein